MHLQKLSGRCFYHKATYNYLANLFCDEKKKIRLCEIANVPARQTNRSHPIPVIERINAIDNKPASQLLPIPVALSQRTDAEIGTPEYVINMPASKLLPIACKENMLLPSELINLPSRAEERVNDAATKTDSALNDIVIDNNKIHCEEIIIPTKKTMYN